jgi:hypothetical protein
MSMDDRNDGATGTQDEWVGPSSGKEQKPEPLHDVELHAMSSVAVNGERILPSHVYEGPWGWASICSQCYRLYEDGRSDGFNQDCRCRSRWIGKPRFNDLNQNVDLCACCGLEAVETFTLRAHISPLLFPT